MADLAHRESIERNRQAPCNLGRDGHSPAGEAHDHSRVGTGPTECRCQLSARICAILEDGAHDWIVAEYVTTAQGGVIALR